MVLGVVAALWLSDRRYRKAGGRPGVILDISTVAVPAGLVGARVYSVLTDFHRYFGQDRDWVDVLRVWDGGMGVAGAVAAGVLAAWLYCRWSGIELAPVALAATPALAVAQAISVWGNWFAQELYGPPSGLPWAVAITPLHRVAPYQTAATFQPLFLYESALDLLIAAIVSYAIHRFVLSGGRAFALYAALWATSAAAIETVRIDYSPQMFGLRSNLLAMLVVLAIAVGALVVARHRRQLRLAVRAAESAGSPRMLRPRSSRAVSGQYGLAGRGDGSPVPPSPASGTQPS